MKINIQMSEQVRDFVRGQPPEIRRRLRLALRSLETEKGDIRSLEEPLEGYFRLRTGSFRIIFSYAAHSSGRQIRCLYAEHRSTIYEQFIEELKQRL